MHDVDSVDSALKFSETNWLVGHAGGLGFGGLGVAGKQVLQGRWVRMCAWEKWQAGVNGTPQGTF